MMCNTRPSACQRDTSALREKEHCITTHYPLSGIWPFETTVETLLSLHLLGDNKVSGVILLDLADFTFQRLQALVHVRCGGSECHDDQRNKEEEDPKN